MLDILFIDVGVQASVEVFELREIPPPFLRDLVAIPPQVVASFRFFCDAAERAAAALIPCLTCV